MTLRGSLTVFLSLVLLFITGLFFTMSEAVRITCVQKHSLRAAAQAADSFGADYCRPLYEWYGILAVDGGYTQEELRLSETERRFREILEENLSPEGEHFFRAYAGEVSVLRYQTLPADQSAGLFSEALDQSRYAAVVSAAEKISKEAEQVAQDSRQDLKTLEEKEASSVTDEEAADADGLVDPTDTVEAMKKQGLLSLVLPSQTEISEKRLEEGLAGQQRVECRTEQTSSYGGADASEQALFPVYVSQAFQSFVTDRGHPGLAYEKEYLLCGCSSDRENLEGCVRRLLALREVENFASICASSRRRSEAKGIALAVAGVSLNPVILPMVQAAVMASWAYLESVLDVRLLLSGGKVALIKTDSQWTSSLSNPGDLVRPEAKAKECENGLDYDAFLLTFLLISGRQQCADRALDVMERAVRTQEHYENFSVSTAICRLSFSASAETVPLFLSFVPFLPEESGQVFSFSCEKEFSYY